MILRTIFIKQFYKTSYGAGRSLHFESVNKIGKTVDVTSENYQVK